MYLAKVTLAGWMNAELERIWKESIITSSKYHPGICLVGNYKKKKYLYKIVGLLVEIRIKDPLNITQRNNN
jgi:hypothetical protein